MKYRLLQRGDVLPASFMSALQEYVGSDAINLVLTLTNATTVQIPAGAGSAQAAIGVEGLWRYRATPVTAAVSGVAGTKDVFVTAANNNFANTPQPDTDNTNYDFGLVVVAQGNTPTLNPGTVDVYRKVGEVDWDGTKVTAIRQMAGLASALSPVAPTAPTRDVTPLPVHGTADQVAPLATFSAGASLMASVGPDGVYDGQGFSVAGTPLASTHLSDTVALARLASPTFTGDPQAPTPAADDNDTSIATTAWVMGQLSAVGDGTPAMDGVAARGTSVHLARADHVHPSDTLRAPLVSPTFTGTPAAPTAAVDTNTSQVASAAPAMDAAATVGVSTRYARADHVHPTDTSRAPLASPTFTGTPAAPLAAVDTNTSQIATTAFVVAQGYLKGSAAATTYAPLASPTFTGTPAAPLAPPDTNTSQIATTAFVIAQASATAPAMDAAATVGVSTRYARADHVHPTDTSRAPLASPTFTGVPAAPTPTAGGVHANDNTLATTAFVTTALAGFTSGPSPSTATPAMDGVGAAGVAATYARGDHVHPSDTSRAALAGATFTGGISAPQIDTAGGVFLVAGQYLQWRATVGGAADTALYRSAPGTLRTDGDFYHQGNVVVATNNVSKLYFGSALDTGLYRSAAGVVSSTGSLNASGYQVSGSSLASTHLSDTAALARLASPTFTGTVTIAGHTLTDQAGVLYTGGSFRTQGYIEAVGDVWSSGGRLHLYNAGYIDLYNDGSHLHATGNVVSDGYLLSASQLYVHGTLIFLGSAEDTYIERQAVGVVRVNGMLAAGGAGHTPIAGAHVEISHTGAVGVIESYDRSATVSKDLQLWGANISLHGGVQTDLYSPAGSQLRVSDFGVCLHPGVAAYLRSRGDWTTGGYTISRSVSSSGNTALYNCLATLVDELIDVGVISG